MENTPSPLLFNKRHCLLLHLFAGNVNNAFSMSCFYKADSLPTSNTLSFYALFHTWSIYWGQLWGAKGMRDPLSVHRGTMITYNQILLNVFASDKHYSFC